jgi:hypothetical protein
MRHRGGNILNRNIRLLTMLVASVALLAIPAVGQAHHRPGHTQGPESRENNGHHNGKNKSHGCKKPAKNVGFVVRGTLTTFTADVEGTPANEASVSITVTGANRHARNSGELQDTDPAKPGTQVKGGQYTATASTDPFTVKLVDFGAGETPAAGDAVKIIGKIARTKARCAPDGTSLADRYGDVNVRKVVIHDAD